ncbi:muscle M-line assembly protein unc-89-like [Vanessa tameamea]|uniref:Muscle M-line assembly protein unc-89-like n=1 Tax=Vanessa tameamea TaxID=334116 RepID=A0A8B8INY0_VANTA
MSDDESDLDIAVSIQVPVIKSDSEAQTSGRIISRSRTPVRSKEDTMEIDPQSQSMSIRKRRNLSKNRGSATRQREKTPEPGRISVPHEDTTSEDEEIHPQRSSREIEADNTYEEMKRLVQEQVKAKDPVYDIDTDEILEARVMAANERRRRSISPFALPDKDEILKLERKGSFIDPSNKFLSTNYTLSLKDEGSSRRGSLTMEFPENKDTKTMLSTPPLSPKDKEIPQSFPTPPKKLEEIIYPDEVTKEPIDTSKMIKTSVKKEVTPEEKEIKQSQKSRTVKDLSTPGELVTKVIEVERTPSKKLTQDQKPVVEIRERVVRTPSKKSPTDAKSVITKPTKQVNEPQSKVPPVKPARSKSSSRFVSKTSESEMSEDQTYQQSINTNGTRRKVIPTPRRFIKNRSPRAKRSQSVNRAEDTRFFDLTATGMSQTSQEIIELMQKARARSLSLPKDDQRLPSEYKRYSKILQTPNKTPVTLRQTRGISCPKTIQIISDREILSGLTSKPKVKHDTEKQNKRGFVDVSQSEYTSSCYSSSPSENEYEFDLLERSAELTRKLKLLSNENDTKEFQSNIVNQHNLEKYEDIIPKSTLRKRSIADKNKAKKIEKEEFDKKVPKAEKVNEDKTVNLSPWKFIANWRQFKNEHIDDYNKIRLLRNRCICDLLLLIFMCGLGGMLFKTLEGSFENAYKCGTRSVKRDFIETLWRESYRLREEEWKSLARRKLHEFEDQLHTAHEAGVTSYSGQKSWNFMNSFVYCLTLVTTIGYGHIAPKTTYGRVATIGYAIIGIPLFLIVLADFGKLFTRIIKFFWAFIRRFYYTRSCKRVRRTETMQEVMKGLNIVYDVVRRPSQIFNEEDVEGSMHEGVPPPVVRKPSDVPPPLPPKPGTLREIEIDTEPDTPAPSVFEIDDEFNLPISVAIFILVVYIIIGAVGYNFWETWNFFESFYFVFISMSTIGLGDLVPDHPMFMMASILYLVFGLALTSMCINVVQVKLSDTFKQASAKLGATIGLKVAEEDGSLVPITPPPIEVPAVHKSKSEIEDIKSKEDCDAKTR